MNSDHARSYFSSSLTTTPRIMHEKIIQLQFAGEKETNKFIYDNRVIYGRIYDSLWNYQLRASDSRHDLNIASPPIILNVLSNPRSEDERLRTHIYTVDLLNFISCEFSMYFTIAACQHTNASHQCFIENLSKNNFHSLIVLRVLFSNFIMLSEFDARKKSRLCFLSWKNLCLMR